ncbi:hypothetical protein Tco_1198236, partial [Tanacetum coccineum]
FNSLVHSLRALSTLRRSGLRTASATAKPCQEDSSEFYLITGRIPDGKRYHPGCKDFKLTHLCFADNLLILSYGNKESIKVIRDSLDDFSNVSGLKANLSKSTIFFGNVNKGRMQLIASMLRSMQIYWALVFLLPKSIVKDIERVRLSVKLRGKSFWEVNPEYNDSWMWKVLLRVRDKATIILNLKLGMGRLFYAPILKDCHDKAVWRCNDGMLKNFSVKQTWEDYKDNKPNVFEVYDAVKDKGYLKGFKQKWMDTINHMAIGNCKAIDSVVRIIVFGALVYYVWQERNKRCFTSEKRSAKDLADIIFVTSKMRLMSLKCKHLSVKDLKELLVWIRGCLNALFSSELIVIGPGKVLCLLDEIESV